MTPLEAWSAYTDFTIYLLCACAFGAGWIARAFWEWYGTGKR